MPASDYPETQGLDTWLLEGRWSIRTFDRNHQTWTTQPIQLATAHWYPTQLTLPDGRVVVSGGYYSLSGPPNDHTEIVDTRTNPYAVNSQVDPFLDAIAWDNLYPSVYLLPMSDPARPGSYFILKWSCALGWITTLDANSNWQKVMDMPGLSNSNWCAATSANGASAMLPYRPDGNGGYKMTYMMFGGHTSRNGTYVDPATGQLSNAITSYGCSAPIPALGLSFRLELDAAKIAAGDAGGMQFIEEDMPVQRNHGYSVLLPNGKILLTAGFQYGKAGGSVGGGGSARIAAYNAVLYDPDAPQGQRYTCLGASKIKRFYHGNALLLPSGDVLVAGSEQDEPANYWCNPFGAYLAQFQSELFKLPYAFQAGRPDITTQPPANVQMGATFTIGYTGTVNSVTMVAPAAVTHSLDMGQKVIFLQVLANTFDATSNTGTITVRAPCMASNIANPGWYMIFLLNNDLPCNMAAWVQLAETPGGNGDCVTAGPTTMAATNTAAPAPAPTLNPKPTPAPVTPGTVPTPTPTLTPTGAGTGTGGFAACPITQPCPAKGPYTNCLPPCPSGASYYYCQAAAGGNANGCKPYSTGPWSQGPGVTQCSQQCVVNGPAAPAPVPTLAPTPTPVAIAPTPTPVATTGGIPACPTGNLPSCPVNGAYTTCRPLCPSGQYYYCQAANGGNVNGCKPYSTGPWLVGTGTTACLQQCLTSGTAGRKARL